jgi:hypothetical protein
MKKFGLILFLAAAGLMPAVDPQLLGLMAPEASMMAGVHADRIKASSFGQYVLRSVSAEDAGFRKFIDQTGFDPRYDVTEIVVATLPNAQGPDHGLVACRGIFQPARIFAAARQNGGATVVPYKTFELLLNEGGKQALAFVDNSIALFGNTDWVKAALDRRGNPTALAPALVARIEGLSANQDLWFYSQHRFAASNGKSQAFNLEAIEQFWGGLKFGELVTLQLDALARSPEDATALTDVVRFVVAMVRGNAKDMPPAVTAAIDSMQLSATGRQASMRISLPEKQLEELFDLAKPKKVATKAAVARR